MSEMNDAAQNEAGAGLFAPVLQAQTYLNILYLLLAFPLGIFYFTFLVTGLSVGLSLVIVWVGIPILLLVLAAWWGLAAFERVLAIRMLGVDIPPMRREKEPVQGIWPRIKQYLRNPVTWKGLAYLFARFPLGIFSFVVVVVLVSVSLSFIATPFLYPFLPVTFDAEIGNWVIDSFGEALFVGVLGVGLGLLSVYVMNWLAYASGWFAKVMLGDPRAVSADSPRLRPQSAMIPAIKMNAQARAVVGVALVGLGLFAAINQFIPSLGQFFWPVALIIIGGWLIAPRLRKALGDGKVGEAGEQTDR